MKIDNHLPTGKNFFSNNLKSKRMVDSKTVDTFFDRSADALPSFVPALPSLKVGLAVGIIIFVLGTLTAITDRENTKSSDDPIEKTRWLFIVAITIYVAAIVTDFVKEKHYAFAAIALNKQHYANVAWLREYIKAFTLS